MHTPSCGVSNAPEKKEFHHKSYTIPRHCIYDNTTCIGKVGNGCCAKQSRIGEDYSSVPILSFLNPPPPIVSASATMPIGAEAAEHSTVYGSEKVPHFISQLKSPTIRHFHIRGNTYHTRPPYKNGNAVRRRLRSSRGVLLRISSGHSSNAKPQKRLHYPPTRAFAYAAGPTVEIVATKFAVGECLGLVTYPEQVVLTHRMTIQQPSMRHQPSFLHRVQYVPRFESPQNDNAVRRSPWHYTERQTSSIRSSYDDPISLAMATSAEVINRLHITRYTSVDVQFSSK